MLKMFFMRCTNRTEPICIEKNLFGESKQSKPYLQAVEIGDYGFLYNLDSGRLIGPWEALSRTGLFEKDAWGESRYLDDPISFETQIKVKPLWDELYYLDNYTGILMEINDVYLRRNREGKYYPAKNVYPDYTGKRLLSYFEKERDRVQESKKSSEKLEFIKVYKSGVVSINADNDTEFTEISAHLIISFLQEIENRKLTEKLKEEIEKLNKQNN
jgi:hypothetical protein